MNLSRLLLGKATYGDKQPALRAWQDVPDLGDAIPPGRGLFEMTAGSAITIQPWYHTAEQRILAEKLAERITVLDEAKKMDVTPFMMKMPEMPGEVFTPTPATAAARGGRPAEVVDLGEMELDLDDLDWSDMELDLDAPEEPAAAQDEAHGKVPAASAAEPEEELEEDEEAVLLMDVDGTLAPFTYRDGLEHMVAPGHGTIMYDQVIVNRIAALPVTKAWLTSWEDDAPDNFGELFPTATDIAGIVDMGLSPTTQT